MLSESCLVVLKNKLEITPHVRRPDEKSVTANIIFNLAQLGIPIRDSQFFDVATYLEIVEIQKQVYGGESGSRAATQSDIDAFLG